MTLMILSLAALGTATLAALAEGLDALLTLTASDPDACEAPCDRAAALSDAVRSVAARRARAAALEGLPRAS